MPSERPLSGSLLALGAVTLLSAAGALGRHGGSFAISKKKKAQALASMKEMLERKYDHVAFLVKPTRFGDDLDRVHHYDLQDLIGDASDAGISEGWKVPAGSERVWHSFRDVSFSGIAKAAQVLERFRESGEVLDLESGDEILRFDAKKPFHLKRRAKKPAKKSKTSRSRKKKIPAEMKPRRGIKNGLVYIELPDYEPSSSEPKKRSYDYVRIHVRDHIPNLKTQNKIIEACGQCGVDGWDSFRDAEYSTYYVTKVTHTALERVADMLDQEGMTGEIYPDRSLPIRFGRGPAIDFD